MMRIGGCVISKIHLFRSSSFRANSRFLDWLFFLSLPSLSPFLLLLLCDWSGDRREVKFPSSGREEATTPRFRSHSSTSRVSPRPWARLCTDDSRWRGARQNPVPSSSSSSLPSPSLLRAAPRANFARAPRFLPSFLPSDTHSAPAIACPRATKTNQYPPPQLPSTARGHLFRLLPFLFFPSAEITLFFFFSSIFHQWTLSPLFLLSSCSSLFFPLPLLPILDPRDYRYYYFFYNYFFYNEIRPHRISYDRIR